MLSYLEVYDGMQSMSGCNIVECDNFVSYNIFWCRRQAGTKNIFVCWFIGVCISVQWRVERAGM